MSDSLYDTGVRPAFDAYLLELSKEVRDYGKYWSASSAGYCMRKNMMEKLKVPYVDTDSAARMQRVFLMGHKIHETVQQVTKDAGLSVSSEEEIIDDKIMVKGHYDDIIKTDFGLVLYDYKSVNSQAFKYKKDKMSRYHTYQLGTYMYMLRKNPKYKDLKEARIMNISKDDWRMAEIQLLYTPALEKLVYEYWATLNGYWNNKQLPKCTCADYEINSKTGIGFMADPRYNPYYYNDEPCSLAWIAKMKDEGRVAWVKE